MVTDWTRAKKASRRVSACIRAATIVYRTLVFVLTRLHIDCVENVAFIAFACRRSSSVFGANLLACLWRTVEGNGGVFDTCGLVRLQNVTVETRALDVVYDWSALLTTLVLAGFTVVDN